MVARCCVVRTRKKSLRKQKINIEDDVMKSQNLIIYFMDMHIHTTEPLEQSALIWQRAKYREQVCTNKAKRCEVYQASYRQARHSNGKKKNYENFRWQSIKNAKCHKNCHNFPQKTLSLETEQVFSVYYYLIITFLHLFFRFMCFFSYIGHI